jgi:DNA-nicking Smr family endonuclease
VNHRIPIEESLDLHAFHPRDIPSVVDEYLHAAHAAGFVEVRLIHGRGKGVQRGIVQSILEDHPLVGAFWDAPDAHLGATVVQLVRNPDPGSVIAAPTR